MDALVQCTEQETENDPVPDRREREPQVAAARPNQKSRCGQQADVDRELQEATGIRALRGSSHGLAVKASYRNCIDIHHASLIGNCRACGAAPAPSSLTSFKGAERMAARRCAADQRAFAV